MIPAGSQSPHCSCTGNTATGAGTPFSDALSFIAPDNSSRMRTQVGIIGAGPAGLLLGHPPQLRGIEGGVLEKRRPEENQATLPAGGLEQGTVDLLGATRVGARLRGEGRRAQGAVL